jgi:hypothetical protein
LSTTSSVTTPRSRISWVWLGERRLGRSRRHGLTWRLTGLSLQEPECRSEYGSSAVVRLWNSPMSTWPFLTRNGRRSPLIRLQSSRGQGLAAFGGTAPQSFTPRLPLGMPLCCWAVPCQLVPKRAVDDLQADPTISPLWGSCGLTCARHARKDGVPGHGARWTGTSSWPTNWPMSWRRNSTTRR